MGTNDKTWQLGLFLWNIWNKLAEAEASTGHTGFPWESNTGLEIVLSTYKRVFISIVLPILINKATITKISLASSALSLL